MEYCLYLILGSYDEEHLVTKILRLNRDYKSWEHYQKSGFHFQLTKWSKRNFDFINIIRKCKRAGDHTPDIISTKQETPGAAVVSFKSSQFNQIADQLERLGVSPVRGEYRGFLGYTADMPEETTANKATEYIMESRWYLVKVSRHPVDKVVQVESNTHEWRTSPRIAIF